MPADKGVRLHDDQGLVPVEPVPEPDEGEAHGIRSAPGLDMARLIEGQLFAQKEILCGECHGWRRGRIRCTESP